MKAPPLAWGMGAGLLALLLLSPLTGRALGDLGEARKERARLAQAAALPDRRPAILPDGMALRAADPVAARAAMMARVQRLAKAGGVLVEETNAIAAPPGLAALRIRVSGAEKAVLALADAFEREVPLMRFRSWQIEPIAGGVRLTGEAAAAQ